MAAQEAASLKAAKVGELQEIAEKAEAVKKAIAPTHSTDEVWTANMPGSFLAQQKHKSK